VRLASTPSNLRRRVRAQLEWEASAGGGWAREPCELTDKRMFHFESGEMKSCVGPLDPGSGPGLHR